MPENTKLPDYVTDKRGITLNSIQRDANNPNSFTVSEEEAEKLRAMAMANNGSEMSPEMQAAMGMTNGDYDQKIPKNIHNQICYDEAHKNNEKYRKEANTFTDSIIPDNATKEILDEVEATTDLSNFDFGDISDYLNKLNDLSFLEAVSYKKKIDAEIARWKSCWSMLKAISDLKLDDNVNRELMKINAMEDYKFTESIDDFEAHYEENLSKLEQIATKLAEIVNIHKHEMDSTKFLTGEMIHLMTGKLNKLDPNGMNYNYNKVRMETVIEAFSNRLDLSFLTYKLEVYLQTNKDNIKRDFRDSEKLINSNRRTKVINDLIRFFNEDITYAIFEMLKDAFYEDIHAIYLMMGLIAKIMNTEKKTSKDVWAKVFALNLSDIYNSAFDIETEGDLHYIDKISRTIYPILNNYIKSQKKFGISLEYGTTLGLKVPEKKKPVEIIDPAETINLAPTEETTVF